MGDLPPWRLTQTKGFKMNSLFSNMMPTEHDVPTNLSYFQDDVQGIGALVKAVREMIAGKVDKAYFKTGKHDGCGWIETGGFVLTIETIEGKKCFREGNSSVVASHNPHAFDDAYIVGTLIANFGHNVFRQKI